MFVEKSTNKVHILCSIIYGTRKMKKFTLILPQGMRIHRTLLQKSEKTPPDFSSCVVDIMPHWKALFDMENPREGDSTQLLGTL